eukprot:CAMPEP_0197548076 /NCGR_PEP_ID=MMETSP1320-20131121/2280_1 /TAXON_ID=91990 /ORGANISM="Bolidomonas sp., Strain RCC2347" /LENGTH=381 /DNA_ID=CAMNT_0043108007 /DNA_START=112 /DNA_END=1254 /DNA_ORIENTATION=+
MKGTLLKRRDVFKTYRPRLFVLDPPLLHYYLTPADVAPRKSIFLTGCKIKYVSDTQDGIHNMDDNDDDNDDESNKNNTASTSTSTSNITDSSCFTIESSQGEAAYYLQCKDKETRESWIKALQAATAPTPPTPRNNNRASPSPTFNSTVSDAPTTPSANSSSNSSSDSYSANVPPHLLPPLAAAHSLLKLHSSAHLPSSETDSTPTPWTFLFSKKGILAGTLSGRHLTVRGSGVMSQPWPLVFSTVINVYNKELYDSQFDAGKRVATYNDRCFVDHLLFKPVWPTSPREFLNAVSWRVEAGKLYIAATEAKGLPGPYGEPARGRVRGECVIGGWVIEKDEATGGTRVSIVVSSDLKGGLPGSIVAAVTRQQAMFPRIIEKW